MMLFWLSVTASLVAVAGCGFLVTATILVARAAGSPARPRAVVVPAVTVLKPLHGDEPGLLDNLGSFCSQDYPGPIQVVFGVQDPGDGAVAVVEQLQKTQIVRDLDLVIETKVHGLNRKVSNLVNMAPRIRHDVVVLADSDMRVEPDYLSRVTAALDEPGVGAVTCLYYGVPVAGMWSSLSALAINAHFLPGVVFGSALGLARPCFGSTLALRRQTLGEIGGFIAFVDCLADDYAMGVVASGCRWALLRQVERAYALPSQSYWLVPARDLLSFILFVVSFFGRDVSWKGHRYRMVAGGSWVSDRGSHAP